MSHNVSVVVLGKLGADYSTVVCVAAVVSSGFNHAHVHVVVQ